MPLNFCKAGKTDEWCGSAAKGLFRGESLLSKMQPILHSSSRVLVLVHQQLDDSRGSLSTERGHFITGHSHVAAKLLLCDLKLSCWIQKNSCPVLTSVTHIAIAYMPGLWCM